MADAHTAHVFLDVSLHLVPAFDATGVDLRVMTVLRKNLLLLLILVKLAVASAAAAPRVPAAADAV